MAFFQWQRIDPTEADIAQALAEAFGAAVPKSPTVAELRAASPWNQQPHGSTCWERMATSRNKHLGRLVAAWWTDAAGRRHIYFEADEYQLQGEPHPLWRCRQGAPAHPLWVISPRHVVQVGDEPDAPLRVLCDCGEIGTPEGIGWMGTTCGPCHDRLAEGDYTAPPARAYHSHRSSVNGLAFLDEDIIASCGYRDSFIVLFDGETGRETRHEIAVQGGAAGLAAMLIDSCVVVAFSRRLVVCWGAFSGEEIWRSDCPGELMGVAVSPLGDWIAVDAVSQTYLLDANTGYGNGLSDDYAHFAFSFDGDILYTFDHDSRSIVGIDPGTEDITETGLDFGEPEEDDCYSLVCHPTERLLACGGDHGRLRLGDPEDGTWLWQQDGPPGMVSHLAFTSDGQTLASGHGDVVAFWNVETGTLLGVLRVPGYTVGALAFSPEGETLAVGDEQGVLRLLPWRKLLALC